MPAFAHLTSFPPDPDPQRAAITAAHYRPEPDCVAALRAAATLAPEEAEAADRRARTLVEAVRRKPEGGPVRQLMARYDLSSDEGTALMCLAEALLRIPDTATRDALIRDKIGPGDWRGAGDRSSLVVDAASWGLAAAARLIGGRERGGPLARLAATGGLPLVRRSADAAMRLVGEEYVTGETIEKALKRGRQAEARGFRFSYDMLGEAALTAADARAYAASYRDAIEAIGRHARGRGVLAGPGISIKLSALHPRYERAQRDRVLAELAPTLLELATLARRHDIGLNIDAEEADRLELSLELLEGLCEAPALAGWDGIGFVVQAYGRRAPAVIDWLIELARRTRHRLMVRLVKGAYWDSEIKRAQIAGLPDFPVLTRKAHTDVSYLACARRLLDAGPLVFPQFASHNAHAVATVAVMAGDRPADAFEFQCLHGMSDALHEEIVGERAVRIYAPVGPHRTLLAYLVRRLLENGANASFLNRVRDRRFAVDDLVADPLALATGQPHAAVRPPPLLFGPDRPNPPGLDLADELVLRDTASALARFGDERHRAAPTHGGSAGSDDTPVLNPADRRDVVGHVSATTPDVAAAALATLAAGAPDWNGRGHAARATILRAAADALEADGLALVALIVREGGRTVPNADNELREAIDFLRYYAAAAADLPAGGRPLGVACCISPWNFPLAIFVGQVAAALAAGNAVAAKPAAETPLVAARAVALLHRAGVPADALALVPGDGAVGAALVADPRVNAVLFTGSTGTARAIARRIAGRLNPDGSPVVLVAETGGQNALVADSSALAEQLVVDARRSAFDSAGQRCSALRLLCLPDATADDVLRMLRGAVDELTIGPPDRLATDVGPVISAGARDRIDAHLRRMRAAGHHVHAAALPDGCAHGSFVAPAIVEIDDVAALGPDEVFGPVLHVLRYRPDGLDELLERIRATGYGLTFGIHTRIGARAEALAARAPAGNVYVNRDLIGAVVGAQPFGGSGLSGTGPKAGGPLTLRPLRAGGDAAPLPVAVGAPPLPLPGPVGEANRYAVEGRGRVLCLADDDAALARAIATARATGNRALAERACDGAELVAPGARDCDAVLFAGTPDALLALLATLAARDGPIVPVIAADAAGRFATERLLRERAVSVNTAAAGGDAALLALEEG